MIILPLRPSTKRAALRAAIRVLKKGGVIAFPTETSYGLGCDPRNAKAVAKLFRIKGRADKKPPPLISGAIAHVSKVARLEGPATRLARRHWPGALTLVLPARPSALAAKIHPTGTVGIRVTSHAFAKELARAFGYPIVATSANVSGHPPAFSGRGVVRAFPRRSVTPDLLLDAGALPRRKPSTVARVGRDGTVQVLRQGSVRLKST